MCSCTLCILVSCRFWHCKVPLRQLHPASSFPLFRSDPPRKQLRPTGTAKSCHQNHTSSLLVVQPWYFELVFALLVACSRCVSLFPEQTCLCQPQVGVEGDLDEYPPCRALVFTFHEIPEGPPPVQNTNLPFLANISRDAACCLR